MEEATEQKGETSYYWWGGGKTVVQWWPQPCGE